MPTPLRDDVATLTDLAAADVAELFRQITSPLAARDGLLDLLPALVETYGLAAATVAADWYDELRDERAVRRRFRAIPAEVDPGRAGTDELARWAVGPLFTAGRDPDWDAARSLVTGGLQRRVADVARSTVATSAVADPSAEGWQRVGSGDCDFCDMLIGRGAVYSEATADFASHDHCRCGAEPAFRGQPRPVRPYTPTNRSISDADRARVREYLAEHPNA